MNKKNIKNHVLKTKVFSLFSEIKRKISDRSLENKITSLNKISRKKTSIYLAINFFLGSLILIYTDTFFYFIPHLICLTLNIICTLLIGVEYANTIAFLEKELTKKWYNDNNIELSKTYERFRYKALHNLNFTLCFIVLAIFFWGIFSQHYIKLDIVGCYAIFMVTITVSISVIGYSQYIWLLWFLYRVSYCPPILYNKIVPAYTPFLVKIGTLTKHAKWCFFIEGFLYVFEYFILIFNGNNTISSIKIPDKTSFLVTWGVIFIVIILAFPIIIYVQEFLLSKIVSNLKNQSAEALFNDLDISTIKDTELFSQMYMCNQMINSVISGPDYPVKIQRLGPSIIAIASCILHITNLIFQYPELKTFLVNRFL